MSFRAAVVFLSDPQQRTAIFVDHRCSGSGVLADQPNRPGSLIKDAIFSFGLLAWAFYFASAAALLVPMIAIGTVPYVVLALCLAQSRTELFRKTA